MNPRHVGRARRWAATFVVAGLKRSSAGKFVMLIVSHTVAILLADWIQAWPFLVCVQ